MSTQPSEAEILEAVRESGYLMEQEVASTVEKLGFLVRTGWAFRDLVTEKSRELDVRADIGVGASKESRWHVKAVLLCECKSTQSPFVFIGRPKTAYDRHYEPMEFIFPRRYHRVKVDSRTERTEFTFRHLNLDREHYYYSKPQKAVQFCKIVGHPGKWVAQHDGIYGNLFLPLVQAVWALREESQRSSQINLLFPMVVVDGPLYYIDSSVSPTTLQKVSHVTFVREQRFHEIEGHFLVDFVERGTVGEFVEKQVLVFARRVGELAADSPAEMFGG